MSNKYNALFGQLVDGSLANIEQGWSDTITIRYWVNNDKRKIEIRITGENIEEENEEQH